MFRSIQGHHSWILAAASLLLACPDPGGETTADSTSTSTTGTTTETSTVVTGGGVVCPGDSFEPNNVPANAPELADGEFQSVVCPLDEDYYAITVSETTYLAVVLYLTRNDGVVGLDLLGPEMQLIRWSSGNDNIPAYPQQGVEALHARLSRGGTYLLRVKHYSGDVIPYNFVVQRFVDETP